jgi:hypothetical protein
MSLSRDLIDRDMAEAFVDGGSEMVRFLEERTPVKFYAVEGMPDYHPEFPGGNPLGGRTIECPIFSFNELGDWAERVTPSPHFPGHILMSEAPSGASVPNPQVRKKASDENLITSAAPGSRLLAGCLNLALTEGLSFGLPCEVRN